MQSPSPALPQEDLNDDLRCDLPLLRRRRHRDALRTEHRDYLRGLADRGLLLVSGPFGADEAPGALLLFRADDKAHVDALVEKDPFTPSGVIAQTDTTEWEPVIGPLLPVLTGDRHAGVGSPTSDTSVRSSTDAAHTSAGSDRA